MSTMATLNRWREKIRYFSENEIKVQRLELFHTINDDAFLPLKAWPSQMGMLFWKKALGDRDTFKLLLFCIGNGCALELIVP